MNDLHHHIRRGLNHYADSIHSAPPSVAELLDDHVEGSSAVVTTSDISDRRRPLRWAAVGAVGATVLIGGAATATGTFPDSVARHTEEAPQCSSGSRHAVASATDSQGLTTQLWVADGPAADRFIIESGPDGQYLGAAWSCGGDLEEVPWVSMSHGGSVRVHGQVTSRAASVTVYLDDGTQLITDEISPDGYFVIVRPAPGFPTMEEAENYRPPEATKVEIFDTNGELIERKALD